MTKLRLELGNGSLPRISAATPSVSTVVSTVIDALASADTTGYRSGEKSDEAVSSTAVGPGGVSSSSVADQVSAQHCKETLDEGTAIIQRLYDVCSASPQEPLSAIVLENLSEFALCINTLRSIHGHEEVAIREVDAGHVYNLLHGWTLQERAREDMAEDDLNNVTVSLDTRFFQTPVSAVLIHGHMVAVGQVVTLDFIIDFLSGLPEVEGLPEFPEIALFALGFEQDALEHLLSPEVASKVRILPASVSAGSIQEFARFLEIELGLDYPLDESDPEHGNTGLSAVVPVERLLFEGTGDSDTVGMVR